MWLGRATHGEGAPGQDLPGEGDHGNLRAAQIRALEAIKVRAALRRLRLDLDGVDQHGQRAGRLGLGVLAQALETPLALVQPVVADVVPRRLGCEVDDDHQRQGPDPLQGEGDAVRPLGRVVDQAAEHAGGDELPDGPAQVDVHGQVAAQVDGHDLGGVGGAGGGEDAPGDAAGDLADEQDGLGGGEEDDEDEGVEEAEADDADGPVAVLGRGPAVEQGAEDGAHGAAHVQAGLPVGGDDVFVFFADVVAVFLVDWGGDGVSGCRTCRRVLVVVLQRG